MSTETKTRTKEQAMKTPDTAAVTRTTVAPIHRELTITLTVEEWEVIAGRCKLTAFPHEQAGPGRKVIMAKFEDKLRAGGVL